MAEESRLNAEKLGSNTKSFRLDSIYKKQIHNLSWLICSSGQHTKYRQHQLDSAIQRSINLSKLIDTSYEESQKDFEKKFNMIREKYNV